MKKLFLGIVLLMFIAHNVNAKNYYFHPSKGDDKNQGTSIKTPLKSLSMLKKINLEPGDSILLVAGLTFKEPLILQNVKGKVQKPIVISSYLNDKHLGMASVNANGFANAVLLENCSYITVKNLMLTANGGGMKNENFDMRCGILITTSKSGKSEGINLDHLIVKDVFFEEPGFMRGKEEVNTANGTQKYGWGIRVLNNLEDAIIKDIKIENCEVSNVSHTGIKVTAKKDGIQNIQILNNKVTAVGGPGVQMSCVKGGLVSGNYINGSGSNNDTRNWSRGSGLWTWTCSDVLIEKNQFLNAKGPGDSAGCHIDYNCDNIIIQYNLSANNAGGFLEILGNNHNCSYRYNISVNDGYRIKGKDGAFQEGKVFWLSGYVGKGKGQGPYNTYIYNNTIYTKKEMVAQMAVAVTTEGLLVANNIFHVGGTSRLVAGDQYKPEKLGGQKIPNSIFENNIFLNEASWPQKIAIKDDKPIFGDVKFKKEGGLNLVDYIPTNTALVKNKGIEIPTITNDKIGLKIGLKVAYDILGNKIIGKPDMGAIEVK